LKRIGGGGGGKKTKPPVVKTKYQVIKKKNRGGQIRRQYAINSVRKEFRNYSSVRNYNVHKNIRNCSLFLYVYL
jgi:hypothetical protein